MQLPRALSIWSSDLQREDKLANVAQTALEACVSAVHEVQS